MRPNIRVEIQNNLAEAMEVEESEDNEEGEISDKEETTHMITPIQFRQDADTRPKVARNESNFTVGINFLDKKEQEKRQERAKRFHLNPEEIKNFTEEDLKLLHLSLGITPLTQGNVKFEAIHIRGITGVTPQEVLEYFLEYAPVSIEYVTEETCNIVWPDSISSTRALHFLSKAVRGMPVRDDFSYFSGLNDVDEDPETATVQLANKDREIELQQDDDDDMHMDSLRKFDGGNSVDISEITATIPPGYWRLGNRKLRSNSILMRYSLKTDQKPYKSELFSKYKVQKASKNPAGIFDRNKDLGRKKSDSTTTKNPWSSLAEQWDEDVRFRERDRLQFEQGEKIEVRNPRLRDRLGEKRKNVEVEPPKEEEETEEYQEVFETVVEPQVKPKKTKIPRMRMYADEEEEKIKRKKLLQRLDSEYKRIEEDAGAKSDLRKVLNMTNRKPQSKQEQEIDSFDLGSKLKNRRKMVFEIKTEMDKINEPKSDIKSRLSNKERDRERERPPIREKLSARRRLERSPEWKSRQRRARRSLSEEEDEEVYRDTNKPRSKVAVVIKTQKQPTVASAVASTLYSKNQASTSSSSSDDEENSTSSSSEDEENDIVVPPGTSVLRRPGFSNPGDSHALKTPLKIEISNDHFRST